MTLYITGALTVIVPTVAVVWLLLGAAQNKAEWLLRTTLVGSIVLIFLTIGTWSMSSYYLRFVMAVLFVGSAANSLIRVGTTSGSETRLRPVRSGITAAFATLGIALSLFVFSGTLPPSNHRTVSLAFPFAEGDFYVIQGGSNVATNPFHRVAASAKYAVDIVRLNGIGNRAESPFPTELTEYQVFGEIVQSPCEGRLDAAVDAFPDNVPPLTHREHAEGNHVVIECQGVRVTLAHLKRGSLSVREGEYVHAGQRVGEAGNSGYSDEPHLHIHANRDDGSPVVMEFDGRFLSIGDRYVAN